MLRSAHPVGLGWTGGMVRAPPGEGFASIKVVYRHSRSSQIATSIASQDSSIHLRFVLTICLPLDPFPRCKKQNENGKQKTENRKQKTENGINLACSLALIAVDVVARGQSTKYTCAGVWVSRKVSYKDILRVFWPPRTIFSITSVFIIRSKPKMPKAILIIEQI